MTDLFSALRTDTRAASIQIGAILSLLILVVLVGGVITTMGTFTSDTQRDATEKELTVVGERLGAQLMKTQDLTTIGERPTFSIRTNSPTRVAGSQYTVTLSDLPGNNAQLVLETASPSVRIEVPLKIETTLQPTQVSGGDLYISYSDGTGLTLTEEPL